MKMNTSVLMTEFEACLWFSWISFSAYSFQLLQISSIK